MGSKIMNILPIDLYHTITVNELIVDKALKIYHVAVGQNEDFPVFKSGTLLVLCTSGAFVCKMNNGECRIGAGQILLSASETVLDVKPFTDTAFGGVVVYVLEELFLNRQRLIIRDISDLEKEYALTCLHLIEIQLEWPREVRSKVVESLLRAMIVSLQFSMHREETNNDIPQFFRDIVPLISRFHHAPAYFYAEKMGMTSTELNNKCRYYSQLSAVEWIGEYVLLEAKDLLRKTRLRLGQIAAMLGFSNQDTFARWFRRLTGELPAEWRA
ncbi:AraC family transcriptional regulator [Parabacteroides bouchesdurhonensis]|uniref:AraC family transcriptional regulator n=1 Tax=Parabacteroides bouchesdurhonensis TaxID=1936995 RepID=UPI001F30DE1C|nr:helix-turn-helix domain-containing protein [Parabacteroides bouchesdurhonensis]